MMGRTPVSDTEGQFNFQSHKEPRNRESDNPSGTGISVAQHMRKEKRVRFADSEIDNFPDHGNSRRCRATRSSPSDDPKTSEYAYFRNVKNRASRDHSRSLQPANKRLKSSKVNFTDTEDDIPSDMLKPSNNKIKFSCPGEMAQPDNRRLYLSPRVSTYDEADLSLSYKSKQRSPLSSKNVMPSGQNLSVSRVNEESRKESRCYGEGIFSAKRNRLRQLVANTLSSDVEKLHSKGFESFDLVSSLLTRLFPKGNEDDDPSTGLTNSNSKYPNLHKSHKANTGHCVSQIGERDKYLSTLCSGRTDEIALSEWNTSPESSFPYTGKGTHFSKPYEVDAELHLSNTRTWNTYPPIFFSGRNGEITPSKWHRFVPEFSLLNPAEEIHFGDELMDNNWRFESLRSKSLPALSDFSFCLPLERYGSSDSWGFKELDESCSPIEQTREEPHRLLLGWNLEKGEDGVGLSTINYATAKNSHPRLTTSCHVDGQPNVNNFLETRPLHSSYLFQNYDLLSRTIPNYHSSRYLTQDFGSDYEDMKYAVVENDHFVLSSLDIPKCSLLADGGNSENMMYPTVISPCRGGRHWFKNELCLDKSCHDFRLRTFSDSHSSDVWKFPQTHSLSRMDEAPGEPYTTFSNVTDNHPYFETTNCPLLLGYGRLDRSEQEFYFDDGYESEYGHRKHGRVSFLL